MTGPFIWLLGIFVGLLLPFIKFIRNCTSELMKYRTKELDNLNGNEDVKLIFSQMFNIFKKYDRFDSYITYSFWSFIGIIVSSVFGILFQYLEWNQYAIILLLLSGVVFSGNFIILAWWYSKHI